MFLTFAFLISSVVGLTPQGEVPQALNRVLLSSRVGDDDRKMFLTIQSRQGFYSWQGPLMVSFGSSKYDRSDDMNICQRYQGVDYPISEETALTVCRLNGFHRVDSIRTLDYYATWWATKIDAGIVGLNCTSLSSCSYYNISDCESFFYYTTLSCSCMEGFQKTSSGCKECRAYAFSDGNSTSCTCDAGYEPGYGNSCDVCWGEFSDTKKYRYCTKCPPGAITGIDKCSCDSWRNKRGDRAWDYDTNTCIPCPENTFRNETSNRCAACPNGTLTYGDGRVNPEDCLPCDPSKLLLVGRCISKVLFYGGISLAVITILGIIICAGKCCNKDRHHAQPQPVSIVHRNPQLQETASNLQLQAPPPTPPPPYNPAFQPGCNQPPYHTSASFQPPQHYNPAFAENKSTAPAPPSYNEAMGRTYNGQ